MGEMNSKFDGKISFNKHDATTGAGVLLIRPGAKSLKLTEIIVRDKQNRFKPTRLTPKGNL